MEKDRPGSKLTMLDPSKKGKVILFTMFPRTNKETWVAFALMDVNIILIYGGFCLHSFKEIFLHDYLSLNLKFLHFQNFYISNTVLHSEKQNIS